MVVVDVMVMLKYSDNLMGFLLGWMGFVLFFVGIRIDRIGGLTG
jgi:hypothetical protein